MTERRRVSGHYAGVFTRFAAFVVDWLIVAAMYGAGAKVFEVIIAPILHLDVELASTDPGILTATFAVWVFIYLFVGLAVTGRTPGKALLGLRVVTRLGSPPGPGAALVRTLVYPVSLTFAGLGFIGVVLGRERRALHDVVAGTAVVYDWGDRPAELPTPLTRWLEKRGAFDAAEIEADGELIAADTEPTPTV